MADGLVVGRARGRAAGRVLVCVVAEKAGVIGAASALLLKTAQLVFI